MAKKTESPWRWVGGKQRLIPTIKQYLPASCHNYFEPFLGGGALFFSYGYTCSGRAYLQDINHALINAYDHLQSCPDELMTAISRVLDRHYDVIRSRFNHLKFLFEKTGYWPKEFSMEYAACFISLNHLCFNGLYRENKSGEFNVPIGTDSKGNQRTDETLDWDRLLLASVKLKGACLNAVSFHPWSNILSPRTGDVVFYDPAYLNEFSSYNKSGFTADDHKILFNQALAHAERGATVVLCGSNNEPTREIYGEPTRVIELSRTVGASKRGKAEEALWVWNPRK